MTYLEVANFCNSAGACGCDASGTCACRENVEGARCERCRSGTFGLSADITKGCTNCFCSGRTGRCTQAQYRWSKVSQKNLLYFLSSKRLNIYFQERIPNQEFQVEGGFQSRDATVTSNGQGVLTLSPGRHRISAKDSERPLYWEVPQQHLGDMVRHFAKISAITLFWMATSMLETFVNFRL